MLSLACPTKGTKRSSHILTVWFVIISLLCILVGTWSKDWIWYFLKALLGENRFVWCFFILWSFVLVPGRWICILFSFIIISFCLGFRGFYLCSINILVNKCHLYCKKSSNMPYHFLVPDINNYPVWGLSATFAKHHNLL